MPMSAALESQLDLVKAHIARVSALDGDGLLALNAAFMMYGHVLVLDDGARIDPTIAADGNNRGIGACRVKYYIP